MLGRYSQFILLISATTLGCQGSKSYDCTVPYVEEFNLPPNESRYNNPPELGYRKPPPKKDFKPGNMMPGGAGGGGMAGPMGGPPGR